MASSRAARVRREGPAVAAIVRSRPGRVLAPVAVLPVAAVPAVVRAAVAGPVVADNAAPAVVATAERHGRRLRAPSLFPQMDRH